MMLSPLLLLLVFLKFPDIPGKPDECLAGGDFWSGGRGDTERFSDKRSELESMFGGGLFKLRSSIFEDGGTSDDDNTGLPSG